MTLTGDTSSEGSDSNDDRSYDDDGGRAVKSQAKSKQPDDDVAANGTVTAVGSEGTPSSTLPDSSQLEAELTLATQISRMYAPGAFRVGGINSNSNSDSRTSNNNNNGDEPPSESSDPSNLYSNGNLLPPNIDIIAEATLVVENDPDTDTLGLQYHDEPHHGGADVNDTTSVAVSAITSPMFPAPLLTSEGDIETGVGGVRGAIAGETTERDNTEEEQNENVYQATIVNDGPLAFLQTKSGKIAASVSGVLIIFLSIGLAVGLGNNGARSDTGEGTPIFPEELSNDDGRVPTQEERENGVLAFAADSFCREPTSWIFPQIVYETFPICILGGVMTQAVVDAQRRAHPFCEPLAETLAETSAEYIPGESEPITVPEPFLCQRSNLIPDISLLNNGAVRSGEIPEGAPITNETIANFLPFGTNTIAYLQLTGDDLVKLLDNTMDRVTKDPFNIRNMAAVPFASGLRYDLHFSAPPGEKVFNIEVLVRDASSLKDYVWLPIESSPQKFYWVVTNNFVARGGDNYLNGITPEWVGITSLSYNDELAKYLAGLKGSWVPPTDEEMSIKSSNP